VQFRSVRSDMLDREMGIGLGECISTIRQFEIIEGQLALLSKRITGLVKIAKFDSINSYKVLCI
jgi:hypothetical protein